MVRLRDRVVFTIKDNIPMFQFQYGTIKGMCIDKNNGWTRVFQFQYGTIKGLKNLQFYLYIFRSFNSSMVRLRVVLQEPQRL